MYFNFTLKTMPIFKAFISIIFVVLFIASFLSDLLILPLIGLLFIMTLVLIYRFKENSPIALFFLYMASYWQPFYLYFIRGTRIAAYYQFYSYQYFSFVLQINIFFVFILFIFTSKNSKALISDKLILKNNVVIFYSCIVIMITIIIFGKTGESIFEAGGYAISGASVSSPLYEYLLIFYLLAYLFSGKIVVRKNLLLIISVIYCFKALLFGNRIETIQMILLVMILFFEKSLKFKMLLLIFIVGVYINTLIGALRGNPAIFLSGDIWSILYPFKESNNIVVNNQTDAIYSSARLIGFIHEEILTFFDRFISFISFVESFFVPSIYVNELGVLSSLYQKEFPVGGGGLISVYFYVWGSYAGVMFIGYYLSKIFNSYGKLDNEYLNVYIIMILITFPRWFTYSPIVMFKACMYAPIIYYLLNNLSDKINNWRVKWG